MVMTTVVGVSGCLFLRLRRQNLRLLEIDSENLTLFRQATSILSLNREPNVNAVMSGDIGVIKGFLRLKSPFV